jgi:glycosyltransferase involved in cell wall biosynthesis
MVTISCLTKFHAFALAEQMNKNNCLTLFHTGFAGQSFPWLAKYSSRLDSEKIESSRIITHPVLGLAAKGIPHDYFWLGKFDLMVSKSLKFDSSAVFVGWSGASLESIRKAKRFGKVTILERGSSHILYQNRILKEEYSRFGQSFKINDITISRELLEYEEADYISVPSNFVFNTFVSFGIPQSKLLLNPYGASQYFFPIDRSNKKFRILYLGPLILRKGLPYLFEALYNLKIDTELYEVWFIGTVFDELKPIIGKYIRSNWNFLGYKMHSELSTLISQCDIMVHPSIEEGLSMVIPQVLSCGVPVIATTNTGGDMLIRENENGFIIPIRNAKAIEERLQYLFENKLELQRIQRNTLLTPNLTCGLAI